MSDDTPNSVTVQFDVSEWEGHLILGCLGMQAENPERLSPEEVSELHKLRDKLVGQFNEQTTPYRDTDRDGGDGDE